MGLFEKSFTYILFDRLHILDFVMIGPVMRRFSILNMSRFSDLGSNQMLSSMIPPVQYQDLPRVGLWNGAYEYFHDFAIVSYIQDTITSLGESGAGLGLGLVIFSISMRLLFYPFILISQRNAMKLQLLSPEMSKIREEIMYAYSSKDLNKIKAANMGMKVLYAKYNIQTGPGIIPIFQLPFVLFFFWTLLDMTKAIDKYPGITTDGFLWFTNLAEADPYFLLPICFAVSTSLSIHISLPNSQMIGPAAEFMKYMKYFVFLGIPITASFPSAVVLNWFVLSSFQLMLNSVVYTETGKKIIGIPRYLPGSILEKFNTKVKKPVFKPTALADIHDITKGN